MAFLNITQNVLFVAYGNERAWRNRAFFPLKIWKFFRSKCKVHMALCVFMFLLNRSVDFISIWMCGIEDENPTQQSSSSSTIIPYFVCIVRRECSHTQTIRNSIHDLRISLTQIHAQPCVCVSVLTRELDMYGVATIRFVKNVGLMIRKLSVALQLSNDKHAIRAV